MLISKSKFVAGVQCLKRLYLIVHEPELAARPDESGQAIIDQGQEVGLLAQQMFPCRVAVESRDREQAIRATRELIENPEIPAWKHRSEEHTSELQSRLHLVCRLLLEKKKYTVRTGMHYCTL